jgi:cytochrome d ubiquinol oxidase subunit II
VGGVVTILIFVLYGAVFLSLKTQGELLTKARATARRLWLPVVVLMLLFLVLTYLNTDILTRLGVNPGVIPLTGGAALLVAGYFIRREREGWAFAMLAVTIAFVLVTLFMILYPRVMISSLNPEWSLTIDNAASSPYTLRLMTILAGIFVPVVLLYQGWSYWVFRKRIENKVEKLVY